MPVTFRAFPVQGICALFDEAPGGGDPKDFSSMRNRPAADPENWLDSVYFHSELDNMEVISDTTVSVSHALIPVASSSFPGANITVLDWGGVTDDFVLVSHGLDYIPNVMIIQDENVLWPGYPVQFNNKTLRSVTPYVTDTEVKLHEWALQTNVTMAGITLDYRILVFKRPPDPSGDKLIDFNPSSGVVKMAFDRFDSSRRYLQVVSDPSPFALSGGRSIDVKNGAPRFVNPDGTYIDPVPLISGGYFIGTVVPPSPTLAYSGTFLGDETILVVAP